MATWCWASAIWGSTGARPSSTKAASAAACTRWPTRRLHTLADTLAALFAAFGHALKQRHTAARYVIDSFSRAVRYNTRIPRCKLLQDSSYYGCCASKRSWFHGFKVPVVASTDGIPVEYYVHAGATADQTGRRGLAQDLSEGSVRYTDAGYIDYVAEDVFKKATDCRQQTARKKNSRRPHEPH